MDYFLQLSQSLLSFVFTLAQQSARYVFMIVLPCICLNGILVSLFLLKSLFFKPKFVENRHQTIAIDPRQHSAELDVNQMETCVDDHGNKLQSAEPSSLRSTMSTHIEKLYRSDSLFSVDYIAPSKEKIKFNEKLGSGFIGVLFKLASTGKPQRAESGIDKGDRQPPPPKAKCAKLIDIKSLRQILEELNYEPGTLVQKIRVTNLFRAGTLGASFLVKYLEHYHRFLDFARKLDLSSLMPQGRQRHRNVLFYEQVLIHDGNNPNAQSCHKKIFKPLAQVERQQLPALVLLIMEQAKMNLRTVIIDEWQHFVQVDTTVEWARQIGSGLAYLHQIGFAHLNLKPENILLFEAYPGELVSPDMLLEQRYILKISDCATAQLLPTASKVLSQSHETSLYEMSAPFSDKFDSNVDSQAYDVHCYAMIILLMLVGYERFGRWFVLPQFPAGLLSSVRYRLMDAILHANRRDVPEAFVDLFKAVFEANNKFNRVSVQQLLQMAALKQ